MLIKSKIIFVIFCILVFISLSGVSAADANQTTLQNNQTVDEIGNFADLNDEISKIPTDGNLTLKKDYTYNFNDSKYKDGIEITKDNIVIDGGGHTIDGAGQARIFNIASNNVTLRNIIFINAYSNENGGAIAAKTGMIKDVFFVNNSAKLGGAIYFDEAGKVINCQFNNNTLTDKYGDGGAIYFNNEGTISNSVFADNNAGYSAGAIYFANNGSVCNSIFTNNAAGNYGGAIYFNQSGTVTNCNFTNNSVNYDGGAINFWRDGKIENSTFKCNTAQNGGSLYVQGNSVVNNCNFADNTARAGGAIQLWENGVISHSLFQNNVANFSGGAIYSNAADVKLNDCNFTDNCAKEHAGGAMYVFATADINDCIFNNNSASSSGGAIYLNENATIEKSTFKFNKANDGGAIYLSKNMVLDNCSFKDNVATSGTNEVYSKENATILYVVHLMILNASDVTYGDAVKISAEVSYNGIAVNSGNVSVVINNKIYSAEVVNGKATIEISNIDAGSYACSVVFDGGKNYTKSAENVNFKVSRQNLIVSASNKAYIINYGGKYSLIVKNNKNNPVSGVYVAFILNGKRIGSAITNSKGAVTFAITSKVLKTAKAGKRNLVIKTSNSNYNSFSKTVKITINKEKTKITAKTKKFKRLSKTKKYAIILKNSKGKAVKKVIVSLKVKGKIYSAKTNAKGKAVFKIKKLHKKGKFTATIKFKGNNYYKAVSKKVKISVK